MHAIEQRLTNIVVIHFKCAGLANLTDDRDDREVVLAIIVFANQQLLVVGELGVMAT